MEPSLFAPGPNDEFEADPIAAEARQAEVDHGVAVGQTALVSDEIEIDHERLTSLVDVLERDIALIEGAMADVEAREFASANAALDVLDDVTFA